MIVANVDGIFYSILQLYLTDTWLVLEMIEGLGDPFKMSRKVMQQWSNMKLMNRNKHRNSAVSELKQGLIIIGTTGNAGECVILNGIGPSWFELRLSARHLKGRKYEDNIVGSQISTVNIWKKRKKEKKTSQWKHNVTLRRDRTAL